MMKSYFSGDSRMDFGRSMVEMLGVLAIIGVLSIGGLYAYRQAMDKYRSNQIADMISHLQLAAAELCSSPTECRLGNWSADFIKNDSFLCGYVGEACGATPQLMNELPYYKGAKWQFGRSAEDENTLVLVTTGLSSSLCAELVSRDWGFNLKKMTIGHHTDIVDYDEAHQLCASIGNGNFYLFWYIE